MNQLYEFDCITRLFDRQHFLKNKNKENYFAKYRKVLETATDLNYGVSDNFFHTFNRTLHQLFIEDNFQLMEDLIRWNKKTKLKQYLVKDTLPYMQTPFTATSAEHIRVPLLAIYQSGYFEGDSYKLSVKTFGEETEKIEELVFRNRRDVNEEIAFPFHPDSDGNSSIAIPAATLEKLPSASFLIFIRYDVYRKLSILRPEQVEYDKRIFNFYTTINSNLGFKITDN
ncbi:hypothetical protein [Planococcus beigongshangi]|uniref:hypothetical protein n=1 Tax=Planococcus beigongshangi TaxID=2782536 RepID=UPI00193BBCC6|nr:hypothetical protein [Planococcus beigongshangi]